MNPGKIRLEWKHKGSDAYFDTASLSDGTLRFIALATLFLQPESYRPSVILVDEPELGLHPYAITLLASLIKQASARTQVIISTRSPFLLDHFQPEDVLVAERVGGNPIQPANSCEAGIMVRGLQPWAALELSDMSSLLIHVEGQTIVSVAALAEPKWTIRRSLEVRSAHHQAMILLDGGNTTADNEPNKKQNGG